MGERRRPLAIIVGGIALVGAASVFSIWANTARGHSVPTPFAVVCHGCPSSRATHPGPSPFTEANWKSLLDRPMRPPNLPGGPGCALSGGDDRYISLTINGSALPPTAGKLGVLRMTIGPGADGPVVIRAAQLNGPGIAIFSLISPPQGDFRLPTVPSPEIGGVRYPSVLLLPLPATHSPGDYYPSYFMVDKPGCYYMQVDGLTFTYTVTFGEA